MLAVLSILVGVLLLGELYAFTVASEDIAHSDKLLGKLRRAEKLVLDLETGMRGYLLSGEPQFLEPYHASRAVMHGQLGKLEALIRNDEAQEERLRAVRRELDQWMRYSDARIAERVRNPTAPLLFADTEGKERVDRIRLTLEEMQTLAMQVRDARSEAARQQARWVFANGAMAVLLAAVLLALNLRQRLQWEAALAAAEEASQRLAS